MSQTIQTIPVRTKPEYSAAIGEGLLDRCGQRLREVLEPCRAAVITDSNVGPLYLERTRASLEGAGFAVSAFSFPAGEGSKNLGTLGEALEFLARERLTRTDLVVALGGGVTGDMAGLAAALYLRGIRYVQLPTSLLAAVDSSVGGKTAVDLSAGKNLAGAFLQPSAVLCDVTCLATLPPLFFADGMAEVIKTGVLVGEELFSLLEPGPLTPESGLLPRIIARCISYKAGVVERDEKEQGERKLLNLGHTVGHAIEKVSGFSIPHGHAVAAGTAIIARAAEALGWTGEPVAGRIIPCLEQNGLPADTAFSPEELAEAALGDKKRAGDAITLVVPEKIGRCAMRTVPVGELLPVIRAGMGR